MSRIIDFGQLSDILLEKISTGLLCNCNRPMFHGQTARIETPAKRLRVAAEMGSPMKKTFLLTALAIALIAAVPARAQGPGSGGPGLGGCSDTPENPTLILAGLASGVFAASNVRTRILARRAPKQK